MNLTVKPIRQKDAGLQIVAIDEEAADEIGLSAGEPIRLVNEGSNTFGRVSSGYPDDNGTGVVRIDDDLRNEINVNIDDKIEITKADCQPVEAISLTIPEEIEVAVGAKSFIRKEIAGQLMYQGKTLLTPAHNQPIDGDVIPLHITSTTPSGCVAGVGTAEIVVSEKAIDNFNG